jgi:hypothetical protein
VCSRSKMFSMLFAFNKKSLESVEASQRGEKNFLLWNSEGEIRGGMELTFANG